MLYPIELKALKTGHKIPKPPLPRKHFFQLFCRFPITHCNCERRTPYKNPTKASFAPLHCRTRRFFGAGRVQRKGRGLAGKTKSGREGGPSSPAVPACWGYTGRRLHRCESFPTPVRTPLTLAKSIGVGQQKNDTGIATTPPGPPRQTLRGPRRNPKGFGSEP